MGACLFALCLCGCLRVFAGSCRIFHTLCAYKSTLPSWRGTQLCVTLTNNFSTTPLRQAEAQQAESVDVINAWAAKVTKGLIKTAIPPGTPFDMVLTNAVYFKVCLWLCVVYVRWLVLLLYFSAQAV